MKVRAVGVVQDVTTSDMDIVTALITALTERVGAERCGLWFGKQTRLSLRGQTLRVDVASSVMQDLVRSKYRHHLEVCCEDLLGQAATIEFHVDPKLAEPPLVEAGEAGEAATTSGTLTTSTNGKAAAGSKQAGSKRNGEPVRNNGRPESSKRRYAEFSDFVVGASNRVACGMAQDVVEDLGRYTPLYLYGSTGVGKTHLLESIVSAATSENPRTRVLFLSAEQFTTYFLEALHHNGLPSFRRKYRSVELLIIDDIHFFCGKTSTTIELLHTIDTLLRNGRQIVLSGNLAPGELGELGPELTSRLSGGVSYQIEPPDHAVRLGIVKQLCERNSMELNEDIQHMIAGRLTDNARQLAGAVNRLHATSRATGEKMTLTLAEKALADMTLHSGRVVHLPEIEKAVCDVFGLQPESLKSDRKSRTISQPRMLAMWLARKHTRSALSEIGDYFGRRSHTTVISAQKRVHGWMAKSETIGGADQHWNAEEVIRRVEAKLRVG